MILIITYDLKSPKDYHSLYEAIKAQGTEGKWWHYMASTWILSTTKTPQQVADNLRPHLDQQDFLFVCELTSNYQGWLPKPAWEWLRAEWPLYNPIGMALSEIAKQSLGGDRFGDIRARLGAIPTGTGTAQKVPTMDPSGMPTVIPPPTKKPWEP